MQRVKRWAPLVGAAAATWPVWDWYVRRTLDPSDEPWGLVALVALIVVVTSGSRAWAERPRLVRPALLLGLYAVSLPFAPMLVSAVLAVAALLATVEACRPGSAARPAVWGLALLSLPLLPSVQFYLGYPLRLAATHLAAAWLHLSGLPAVAQGTMLVADGVAVAVDAPCSGVRMLWASLFLACLLGCVRAVPGLRLMGIAIAAAIAGNTLRAAGLFYVETSPLGFPTWAHDAVGGACFALTAGSLLWMATRMEVRKCAPSS